MPVDDPNAQRLYVSDTLTAGNRIGCTSDQANYLCAVLRLKDGAPLLVFNGRDGEWRSELTDVTKRGCALRIVEKTRPQTHAPDIDYVFAPLKRSRLDYMVQKAAEMGVARLRPVLTQHTIVERVNLGRMRANAIEAAEQCGILHVPDIEEPQKFDRLLSSWPPQRRIIFCDEAADVSNPIDALRGVGPGPLAVIIGPEGGFSTAEREALISKPFTVRISFGPRILRADTAAIAALTLVNAVLGDWK